MGDQSVGGSQDSGFPGSRVADEHHKLSWLDLERDAVESRSGGSRIVVGDFLERQHAHRSIPRRSVNGSIATATRAAATASVPAPVPTWSAGYAFSGPRSRTRAQSASAASAAAEAANSKS